MKQINSLIVWAIETYPELSGVVIGIALHPVLTLIFR